MPIAERKYLGRRMVLPLATSYRNSSSRITSSGASMEIRCEQSGDALEDCDTDGDIVDGVEEEDVREGGEEPSKDSALEMLREDHCEDLGELERRPG
jgi:hypothetical protein